MQAPEGVRRAPVAAAFALTALLALSAGAIYIAVGSPTTPDHPFKRELAAGNAAALAPGADGLHAQMDQMVLALQKKLAPTLWFRRHGSSRDGGARRCRGHPC